VEDRDGDGDADAVDEAIADVLKNLALDAVTGGSGGAIVIICSFEA